MNAVIKAKKKYKFLYHIKFEDGSAAVFRGLTWNEFKSYRSLLLQFPHLEPDVSEDIFKDCLIEYVANGIYYKKWASQEDYERGYMHIKDVIEYIPAGVPDTIVKYITTISGAMTPEKFMNDLNEARLNAQFGFEDRITSLISTVFRLKQEDFDNMTWEEVLTTIAHGELILSGQVPELPFTLSDPDEDIDFDKENKELDSL